MAWEIEQGDVLERLREMSDESVHCVVTSPPYWGLRDYGTARWDGGDSECDHDQRRQPTDGKQSTNQGASRDPLRGGACRWCGASRSDNQIGLEQSPDEYVARLVEVFREVRRVLRGDGTLWLNLGDSYARAGGWSNNNGLDGVRREESKRPRTNAPEGVTSQKLAGGLKEKDLVGVPWLVAFALRADGWYLRSDIIWAKPNPMPESVTDRPTKSHEYVFLMSKSARYYFDQEAVREPLRRDYSNEPWANVVGKQGNKANSGVMQHNGQKTWAECLNLNGRNIRSVWNIATQPFAEAHFATFPQQLVQRCIDAGCPIGGTVLDVFSGSGTTGVVAVRSGRNYIGIELNTEYVAMSERRLEAATAQQGLFTPEQLADTQPVEPAQTGLFATVTGD